MTLRLFLALCFLPMVAYASDLNSKTLSVSGIRLGDTFAQAKKLSSAEIFREGEAAAPANKLCFALRHGGVLLFEADGELGEDVIDNIRVENAAFREEVLEPVERLVNRAACAPTHLSLSDIAFPFGIRLGTSYEQAIETLGPPENIIQPAASPLKILQFSQPAPTLSIPEGWNSEKCGAPATYTGLNLYIDENGKVSGFGVWTGGPYC